MVTAHTQGNSLKIDRNPRWQDNVAAGHAGRPGHEQRRRLGRHDRRAAGRAGAADQERPGRPLVRPDVLHRRGGHELNTTPPRPTASSCIRPCASRTPRSTCTPRPSTTRGAAGGQPRRRPRGDREDPRRRAAGGPSSGIAARHDAAARATTRRSTRTTPDADAAKALLAQAGVQTPIDAGTHLLPRGRRERRHRPADAVRPQAVGIDMKIKGLNSDNYFQFIQTRRTRTRSRSPAGRPTTPTASALRAAPDQRRGRRRRELRRLRGPGARRRGQAHQRDAPGAGAPPGVGRPLHVAGP